jgi:hypothetical protein
MPDRRLLRAMTAAGALAGLACATSARPTPAPDAGGRRANVVGAAPPDCQRIGRVAGREEAYGFLPDLQPKTDLRKGAEEKAARQAAELGATHVVLDDPPPKAPGGQALATGTAYRCPDVPAAASPPARAAPAPAPAATTPAQVATPCPTGCGKDTDCKGDRVCEAGACVDPRPAPPPAAR